jgi:hypothetical protein
MGKALGSELHRMDVRDVLLTPEFAPIRVTSALFGLSRTMIFSLLAKGRIKSVHHKEPGTKKGVRLIELQSVRDYLRSLAE